MKPLGFDYWKESCHWGHNLFFQWVSGAESILTGYSPVCLAVLVPCHSLLGMYWLLYCPHIWIFNFKFPGGGQPRLILAWLGSRDVLRKHYSIKLRHTWRAILNWSLYVPSSFQCLDLNQKANNIKILLVIVCLLFFPCILNIFPNL